MFENVILVDENDCPLGVMEKLESHQKALLHRAVSVFVFNSNNKLLLQKRALSKYHSPGLWTNTACTHPFPNEQNEAAAIRRLHEEMGITVNHVTELFHFIYKEPLGNGLTEHELDHVFLCYSDDEPILNTDEVSEYNYVTLHEVLEHVKASPHAYTVWFKKIIERVAMEANIHSKTRTHEQKQ